MKLAQKYMIIIRITTISILVILVTYGLYRNPGIIKDLKQIITPAAFVSKEQWDLEIQTTYELCRHSESSHRYYRSKTALTKTVQKTFKSLHDGFRQKNKNTYRLRVNVADFCESCRNHQFIGINDHNIVIMKGTPKKPGPVQENIQLPIDQLPDSERIDLRKGIPFMSEKEKLQLLEGLRSLIVN